MNQQVGVGQQFTRDELARLHTVTSEIVNICRGQLRGYLDGLALLFRPRRILGNHVDGAGKETVTGADQNLAELRETYFKACGRPFDLRRELNAPIEAPPTQIQLYEWEYLHEIRTERDRKTVTIVRPLTWVLAYPSTYSLSMVRQVVAGKQERDAESIHSFVLRACLMSLLFTKLPELLKLFDGLRFIVEVQKSPQLGDAPFVTVSAPVQTIRPSDDLILTATGLSGRTSFVEVVDEQQARHLSDPLRDRILRVFEDYRAASD